MCQKWKPDVKEGGLPVAHFDVRHAPWIVVRECKVQKENSIGESSEASDESEDEDVDYFDTF